MKNITNPLTVIVLLANASNDVGDDDVAANGTITLLLVVL